MKKLKLFIVLALLPALLTACGKSDEKDQYRSGQASLDRAAQLNQEIKILGLQMNAELESADDVQLAVLREKTVENAASLRHAIAVDDADKKNSISNRDVVKREIASADKLVAAIDAEIEARKKGKKQKPMKQEQPKETMV
ncbi:MAG: hypothetical protein AABZ31_15120 [Bdellovibrionota bacterium]